MKSVLLWYVSMSPATHLTQTWAVLLYSFSVNEGNPKLASENENQASLSRRQAGSTHTAEIEDC